MKIKRGIAFAINIPPTCAALPVISSASHARNIKKKLFEEDNEYLILNKKVYKKNELYKAIPILLKMCIKKY